ncbi:MAG: hypothetical protein KF857_05320 [Fimbriimonadaceae bacterium]|nr:hypothetical protein [Fimbriimonadaceae bacterium]
MTTIGDVLMIVSTLLAMACATWATLVFAALMFPGRTAAAALELENHPFRAFASGLAVTIVGSAVATVLVSLPLPLVKALGFVVFGAVLCLSFLGMAGLTRLAARQVKGAGGPDQPFAGYLRGAALVVGAASIPFVGWLLFAPVLLVVGVGAGLRAFVRATAPEPFGAEA